MIKTAIVLAGGYGKRMMPLTADANKTALPFPGRSNIARLMHQLHKSGVQNFFIDAHYQASHVIREISKENFGQDVKVKFMIWDNLYPDAESITRIISQNKKYFVPESDKASLPGAPDKLFWVVSGDIFYPNADLVGFQKAMIDLRKKDGNVLGGIGFVLRPQKYMLNRYPSAVINDKGVIEEFPHNRIESIPDAERIYAQCKLAAIKGENNPEMKVPMNTSIYILTKELLDSVKRPSDGSDYDLGKFVFTSQKLREKMLGYVFTPVCGGEKFIYHDLGHPEDYYRAIFTFFLTSRGELKEDYVTEWNSWIGQKRDIAGHIRNSWIGGNVTVKESAHVYNSVVLGNCWLENVRIESSIVLPGTYINYGGKHGDYHNLSYAIVGGRVTEPTFLDPCHLVASNMDLSKVILTPDESGMIKPLSLDLTEADMRLPEEVFRIDPGEASKQ